MCVCRRARLESVAGSDDGLPLRGAPLPFKADSERRHAPKTFPRFDSGATRLGQQAGAAAARLESQLGKGACGRPADWIGAVPLTWLAVACQLYSANAHNAHILADSPSPHVNNTRWEMRHDAVGSASRTARLRLPCVDRSVPSYKGCELLLFSTLRAIWGTE